MLAAAQLAPALRKNELALFALRSPEIIAASARGHRHPPAAARELCGSRSDRSLDGIDRHAAVAADRVRRQRILHPDDVPRSDAAAPGRGNARGLRRQCEPRIAHAAGGAVRLHRHAARSGARGRQGARPVSRHHARAGDPHGAADRRSAVAVARRTQRACASRKDGRSRAAGPSGGRRAGAAGERASGRYRSRTAGGAGACRRRQRGIAAACSRT